MPLVVKHTLRHPSGRVSYRRTYPPELRPFVPEQRRELKVSLGAESEPGFLSRYEAAASQYDNDISKARKRHTGAFDVLDAPEIAFLAKRFEVGVLQWDENARWTSDDHAAKVSAWLDWELDDFRRWRGEGDLAAIEDRWGDEARKLVTERGLVLSPAASEDAIGELCKELNDTALRVAPVLTARLRGEAIASPPQPAPPPRGPDRSLSAPGARLPLLALYDAYAAANVGMTAGVRIEWRQYIEKLVHFLGHDDASRITADDVQRWRDQLLDETTRKGTRRSPVTVRDKYMTALRVTLGYAVEERQLRENVAAQVKVRQPKAVTTRERSFTIEEAQTILAAALQPAPTRMSPEHARARRWVPWLCAYTGARVGEIAQLRGEDVSDVEGVPCIRITPDAGNVKTRAFRLVPLHAHLIETGFLDVVRAVGSGPLFFDPKRQRVAADGNRHVKKVGERLAAWVRQDLGIADPRIAPNHAWRHLFKSLSHGAMEERVADALQGHAPSTTGRGYGNVPIAARAAAIQRFPRFDIKGAAGSPLGAARGDAVAPDGQNP